MLTSGGLVVFLVAAAGVSCTRAQAYPVEYGHRPSMNAGIVSIQNNNTYYAEPGSNVYGSIISQTNKGGLSSEDVKSRTVVVSDGAQSTRVYVVNSGEHVNMYQATAGQSPQPSQHSVQQSYPFHTLSSAPAYQQYPMNRAHQQPTAPRNDHITQLNTLNDQILALEGNVDKMKKYLEWVAKVVDILSRLHK